MNSDDGRPDPPGASSATVRGRRIRYEEIRDGFLAELPATAEEELEYYCRIGMYVFKRWQAIADDHAQGEPIDEDAHDARWHECTERGLEKIRTDVRNLIDGEVQRQRVAAVLRAWAKADRKLKVILKGAGWTAMRAWEGFIGAIGLLGFGLIFVWLAPSITREIRSAMDQTLPVETRPPARQWILRSCTANGEACVVISHHPNSAQCEAALRNTAPQQPIRIHNCLLE